MDDLRTLESALAPRYTLGREIGHGGMATVWLARDLDHDREVAVKVIKPEVATATGIARFAREIRIVGGLTHPNILPLLDSGEADGLFYYVTPYVEGGSLRERLDREGPLALDEAIEIAARVADALDSAHQRDIVHRDVKPENILLSHRGVHVADFGVAHLTSEPDGERLTTADSLLGTPAYMSPEQMGSASTVDRRADVYALGCVLYEMLTGEPPFTGPTPRAVIARHLGVAPSSPTILRPDLPPGVEEAVLRSLAKAPADRFRTAGAFSEALRAGGTGGSRHRLPSRTRRWVMRGAVAAAASLLVLWQFAITDPPPLDANKVVVFPMVPTLGVDEPAAGWDVALAIGAALEHTEPLKWIDGRAWLAEDESGDPASVVPRAGGRIARERGAAHYIVGVVRGSSDSLSVILRLHGTDGDELIAQETASDLRARTTLPDLAMTALVRILPRLLEPGRRFDLTPLTHRSPGSIALSIQGDRAYRQSRFDGALEFYRRAVDEDSLNAFAAIKGAQAASWSSEFPDADRLIGLALRHDSLLPAKYSRFAHGLEAYLEGDAARAEGHYLAALALDDEWAEAANAVAEVYYHLLLPSASPPDSAARHWLERARAVDSTFAPPLYHLGEIALRAGDVQAARRITDLWKGFEPDTVYLRQIELSLDCLDGRRGFDWSGGLPDGARSVLQAGMALAGGARQTRCARGALQAIHDAELPLAYRWTALRALQGLAMAEERYGRVDSLIQGFLAQDVRVSRLFYVYDALAGAPFEAEAAHTEELLRRETGDVYAGQPMDYRWLMGLWLIRMGELERVEALVGAMAADAEAEDDEEGRMLVRGVRAHLAAVRGDTARSLELLRQANPVGHRNSVVTDWGAPLAPERILLAELLLARGQPEEAFRTAALLDHQAPPGYLPFVRWSLDLRARAADAAGWPSAAAQTRDRLAELRGSSHEGTITTPQQRRP